MKYPDFQKLGVEVLSMSIDSMFVHKMWDDHELSKMVDGGVPFAMLSDAGGRVGKVYGVYDEDAGVETFGRLLLIPSRQFLFRRGSDCASRSWNPMPMMTD